MWFISDCFIFAPDYSLQRDVDGILIGPDYLLGAVARLTKVSSVDVLLKTPS